jgi:hypothetical protein
MVIVLLRIILLALVIESVERTVQAAGPLLYQDCQLTWQSNTESDLGGYRAYFGRLSSHLNQVKDVGNRTSLRCSEANAAANGQWFVAVTAYDKNGYESAPSQVMPFQLAGLAEPLPPPSLSEPSSVRLEVSGGGFQLAWTDTNRPSITHRIEVSTSLQPNWTTAAVLPPGYTTFSSFQPKEADWACYRVRGENGAIVSDWAQASGPSDRQFCFAPVRIPLLIQPIVASTVIFEPQSVRLTPRQPGFELSWTDAAAPPSALHRIEISSSTSTGWSSLAVLPASTRTYAYTLPIDASWVCMRIRTEVGRAVSLWAMASGPTDRQFCFAPMATSATANAIPAGSSPISGATASSASASGQTSGSVTAQSSVGSDNQLPPTFPVGRTALPGAISYDSIAAPTVVQKTAVLGGIELRWTNPGMVSASHRIEASSSIRPIWTLSAIMPPGVTTYTYNPPIKSEWACLRIRAELQGVASLWAMASGPTDRQFCFKPGLF